MHVAALFVTGWSCHGLFALSVNLDKGSELSALSLFPFSGSVGRCSAMCESARDWRSIRSSVFESESEQRNSPRVGVLLCPRVCVFGSE